MEHNPKSTKTQTKYIKPSIQLLSFNNNKDNNDIKLKEIIESEEYTTNKLNVPLGKDERNKIYIEEMQNLFVRGKERKEINNFLDTFIINLLYNNKPDEVNIICVDINTSTLDIYANIPHLVIPIVKGYQKAGGALSWGIQEMEYRRKECTKQKVRTIEGYNNLSNTNKFPQTIFILQDLFTGLTNEEKEVSKLKEMLEVINRLGIEGEDLGIYLIILQTEEMNDTIEKKLNYDVYSKIIFRHSKCRFLQDDELKKIQGKNEMIFLPKNSNEGIKIQKINITDIEVKNVLDFIDEQNNKDKNIERG